MSLFYPFCGFLFVKSNNAHNSNQKNGHRFWNFGRNKIAPKKLLFYRMVSDLLSFYFIEKMWSEEKKTTLSNTLMSRMHKIRIECVKKAARSSIVYMCVAMIPDVSSSIWHNLSTKLRCTTIRIVLAWLWDEQWKRHHLNSDKVLFDKPIDAH